MPRYKWQIMEVIHNEYLDEGYQKAHHLKSKGPPSFIPNSRSLAIARRNQSASRLLRLPAELRNVIFTLAMGRLFLRHFASFRVQIKLTSCSMFSLHMFESRRLLCLNV